MKEGGNMRNHRDEEKEMIEDGGRVRVPLVLMDDLDDLERAIASQGAKVKALDAFGRPAGHAPGYCFSAAAAATDDARDEYISDLRNAWRGEQHANNQTDRACAAADGGDPYHEYKQWLSEAWRSTR
jgi:hypothetical protein